MTTLINFLSGWGLAISLLACLAGCALQLRRFAAGGARSPLARAWWIEHLVPMALLEGRWPARVLANDCVFWLSAAALVGLAFAPGHAEMARNLTRIDWPSLPFRWADGLLVVAALGALALLMRHLLVEGVRSATSTGQWLAMLLLLLPLATGLIARTGVPGYGFWLFIHLLSGNVLLWCAPHCRFASLLR